MLGWLRRWLGGGQATPEPQPAPGAQAPSSSVPPPPAVREQLEAAQTRLKQTIPPPEEGSDSE